MTQLTFLRRVRRQAWVAVFLCFTLSMFDAALHARGYSIGGLSIDHPWARETAAGQVMGGGFMTIRNHSTKPDTLLSARSPMAKAVQLHSTTMVNGIMKMREATGGLTIPAKGQLALQPGGHHLMLMGLTQRLTPGATVPMTLTFRRAGTVTVQMTVQSMAGSTQ